MFKNKNQEWSEFQISSDFNIQGLHAHFKKHEYERHAHECYVIGTIESGAAVVGLAKKTFIAPENSIMIINPGESHDGKAYDQNGYIYRMLYLDPQIISEISEECGNLVVSETIFNQPIINNPNLVNSIRQLYDALFNESDLICQEFKLMNALVPLINNFSASVNPLKLAYEPRIQQVYQIIHEQYFDTLTTSYLAKLVGVSRVHLNQLFVSTYGLPIHAYLNHVRLDVAKRMLLSGQKASEVASLTGFNDQSHFIKRFKGSFGITPLQFSSSHFTDVQYKKNF